MVATAPSRSLPMRRSPQTPPSTTKLAAPRPNGRDYEVLPGTVIMKAGTSSVSIPLRVINVDTIFLPSDMLVAKWPARVGKVEVDEGEFVLQGAAVLSLTEPVFTITMKVSPIRSGAAEGGPSTPRSRLKAGDQTLEGSISSLDDSAKVGDAGAEIYEGVVTGQRSARRGRRRIGIDRRHARREVERVGRAGCRRRAIGRTAMRYVWSTIRARSRGCQ